MLRNSGEALRNEAGVTLVEVMVALVVLLLVMMGLLQAALVSIDSNLRNLLRDEAINLATAELSGLRNQPFDDLAVGTNCRVVVRNIRNLSEAGVPGKPYTVCDVIANRADADGSINTRQVEVVVGWNHKGESPVEAPTGREFQLSVTTLRKR